MAQTPERADVVIAGGGFAGLALGIALRQGLGSAFAIIVADPFIGRDGSGDPRASAIAAGARRLFETIGVWEAVAQEAQPILDMAVTDSRLTDKMRPVFLSFGGEVEPAEHSRRGVRKVVLDEARGKAGFGVPCLVPGLQEDVPAGVRAAVGQADRGRSVRAARQRRSPDRLGKGRRQVRADQRAGAVP